MKNAAITPVRMALAAATASKDFIARRGFPLAAMAVTLFMIAAGPAYADVNSQIPVQYGLCNTVLNTVANPLGQIRGLGDLWPIGSVILLVGIVVGAIIPRVRRALMPNLLWGIVWGVFGAALVLSIIAQYGGNQLCG